MFVEHVLYTRHGPKYFTDINSKIPHNNLLKKIEIFFKN